jgi:hypothetical protein
MLFQFQDSLILWIMLLVHALHSAIGVPKFYSRDVLKSPELLMQFTCTLCCNSNSATQIFNKKLNETDTSYFLA